MATAQAVTNEQGLFLNKNFTVGLSGHGGSVGSCYSDMLKKPYKGSGSISSLASIEFLNPAALSELMTVCTGGERVKHETAYTVKVNKDGNPYDSVMGHYLSVLVRGNKVSVLIKGYSCVFFIDDKKAVSLTKLKKRMSSSLSVKEKRQLDKQFGDYYDYDKF